MYLQCVHQQFVYLTVSSYFEMNFCREEVVLMFLDVLCMGIPPAYRDMMLSSSIEPSCVDSLHTF